MFEVKNTPASFNFISVNMSLANIFIKQYFVMMYGRVQLRSKTFDVFKKLLIERLNSVDFSVGWRFKDWRLPEYYTNTLPTSKRAHSASVAMNSRLILYREMIGTHFGKPAKRVRTLCGQMQIFKQQEHILLLFLIIIIIAVSPDEKVCFSVHT
jgi:hypothetical protein